jgi:hypothetical protein
VVAAALTKEEKIAAAKERIRRAKGDHSVGQHPNLVRGEMEVFRHKQNEVMHKKISFEHEVEDRRKRLEALCGSNAERTRMMSVHAASREDTRKDMLRATIKTEHEMLKEIKKLGVKSFAGMADAWG